MTVYQYAGELRFVNKYGARILQQKLRKVSGDEGPFERWEDVPEVTPDDEQPVRIGGGHAIDPLRARLAATLARIIGPICDPGCKFDLYGAVEKLIAAYEGAENERLAIDDLHVRLLVNTWINAPLVPPRDPPAVGDVKRDEAGNRFYWAGGAWMPWINEGRS